MYELNLPLKTDIPCLEYDFAVFCQSLKELLPPTLPPYLTNYQKRLSYYANRVDELKPLSFPEAYRVYIIDYRLNVLFAALDTTGKMATWFSRYGHDTHEIEDYYFGDGEGIGSVQLSGPGFAYDFKQLNAFSIKYGFLPIEEIAMATALVYNGPELADRRLISQYQAQLLLEAHHRRNLVDWKELVNRAKNSFSL